MALGGGTWLFQNKVLAGAYINFKSKQSNTPDISDRGFGTMALELDWGPTGEVFSVTQEDFQLNSMKYFGYDYSHSKLAGLRDLFINLTTGLFYRLNNNPVKAANTYGTAKYGGTRGNDITVVVSQNVDTPTLYQVDTYLKSTLSDGSISQVQVDTQTVTAATKLVANDYVVWKTDATLAVTAGLPMTGGTNGDAVTSAQHQAYLDAISTYYFNTMGTLETESEILALYVAFVKRLRDSVGIKFQLIAYGLKGADYEGIISIKNTISDSGADAASLVYWVTGAEASCAVNASVLNKTYDGEFTPVVNYSQSELTTFISEGWFVFHKVNTASSSGVTSAIKVLDDINTFTSVTVEKTIDFASNQVIRVLDQFAIDIARLFNTRYMGKVPNDNAGRVSLWKDFVAYCNAMQTVRAIQNFVSSDIPIPAQGTSKGAVLSNWSIQPTEAMKQLYMTINVA